MAISRTRQSTVLRLGTTVDRFGFVFSNSVLLGLVSAVPSQEIGWAERLRNDLFCVEWHVKRCSTHFSRSPWLWRPYVFALSVCLCVRQSVSL